MPGLFVLSLRDIGHANGRDLMGRTNRDASSSGLKELRFRLGIKPSSQSGEFEKRAAEFGERVKAVFQKSKKRTKDGGRVTRGMQHRWTAEEDEKLTSLRASGLAWALIAKRLHRTQRAVKNRLSRLATNLSEAAEPD
jgi:DNA invertase Pin-like site-specific DNA recombinase